MSVRINEWFLEWKYLKNMHFKNTICCQILTVKAMCKRKVPIFNTPPLITDFSNSFPIQWIHYFTHRQLTVNLRIFPWTIFIIRTAFIFKKILVFREIKGFCLGDSLLSPWCLRIPTLLMLVYLKIIISNSVWKKYSALENVKYLVFYNCHSV